MPIVLHESKTTVTAESCETTTKPMTSKKTKIMLCGTHINQYNGYSKVVYELAKRWAEDKNVELTLFGFQNFNNGRSHRTLPANVTIVDALQLEQQKGIKKQGFGEDLVAGFIKDYKYDVVCIYNDMSITGMLMEGIIREKQEFRESGTVFVSYIDQVYLHQKPKFIQLLKEQFQGIIAFTDYWKDVLIKQLGDDEKAVVLSEQMEVVSHGFESSMHFPIARRVARHYFGIPQEAFVILNLNRNQPRKRWDTYMVAVAEIVAKHMALLKVTEQPVRPIRFIIGTAMQGCWDLWEIFEREVKKRGLDVPQAKAYLIGLAQPQGLSDRDINIIYNCADIGVNTCDGEGLGLCQLEHMGIGVPQVVPNIGGFKDFCNEANSILIEPKWSYYVDSSRDAIGGETQVSDSQDFADAVWRYYLDPALVTSHGILARRQVLENHQWDELSDRFLTFLKRMAATSVGSVKVET